MRRIMFNFKRWFGRGSAHKTQNVPKSEASESVEAEAVKADTKDFTRPEYFSYSANDLIIEPDAFDAAFKSAVEKAHAGEPYGVALYMALREGSQNSQFLDDLVDELPNWAFAERMPGEHMTHILLNWARATEEGEKSQHASFRFWAILCGWRPGDANALWLDYRIGMTDIPPKSHDPLGRNYLPENLIIAPNEVRVYAHLSEKAEEIMAGRADHAKH